MSYNRFPKSFLPDSESLAPLKEWRKRMDEPTCRCHQNPFIGALGIQQPVILGEPQIDQ